MATKRFVARKIGDRYVMEPKDPVAPDDLLWASVGGALALAGFVRGGPLGWVARFAGGAMIYRGLTGKSPMCRFGVAAACDTTDARHDPGPSHQNDGRPTAQTPVDSVEEAAMESFPASDPPARTAVAASGGPAAIP